MKFWPSDKLEIETTMPLEAVVAALSSKIEPIKPLRFSRDHAIFQGYVFRDGFKISRIIHYPNSFLPVVTGKFLPGDSGIRAAIRLGLHPFVAVFMLVWFGVISLGIIAAAAGLLIGHPALSQMLPLLAGMLVFGLALVLGGFWFEARKQKPMLIELFKELETADAPGGCG